MTTTIQPGGSIHVALTVNGNDVSTDVETRRTLADFLREDLALTGTHVGCEHGVCGACTVEIDGRAVRSCLVLAVQADGANITTIEGLANADGSLSNLQQAFREAHGFQCAFCAPGFLMTTKVLLADNPNPTAEQIREELSGNLCRCTGYHSIIESVQVAVRKLGEPSSFGEVQS
jgi:aerobic-type carbon monoxide dehydrogenase small subunit (CoxS/CutS family)